MDPVRTDARLNTAQAASGLNILAGIWLIIAPFVLAYSNVARATSNDVIVGIAVLVLAAIRAATPRFYAGLSALNALLGLWLIVSPFSVDFTTFRTAMWTNIVTGIVVAVLAVCSAMATPVRAREISRGPGA